MLHKPQFPRDRSPSSPRQKPPRSKLKRTRIIPWQAQLPDPVRQSQPFYPLQPQPQYRQPVSPVPTKKLRTGYLISAILVSLLVVIGLIAGIVALTRGLGSTAQSTPTPAATHMTLVSTTNPTAHPTLAITHSTPHIGGPLSDFLGKYGQPTGHHILNINDDDFTTSKGGDITISVQVVDEQVLSVAVIGPLSWSTSQAQQYCSQFLPPGAMKFNTASPYTDFHSSAGEIVMLLGPVDCMLAITQS